MHDRDHEAVAALALILGGGFGWLAIIGWLWGFAANGGRIELVWLPLAGVTTVPFVAMFCWAVRENLR